MRKIYLEIKAKVIVMADEAVPTPDIVSGLKINCVDFGELVEVEDYEVSGDYEVTDSK